MIYSIRCPIFNRQNGYRTKTDPRIVRSLHSTCDACAAFRQNFGSSVKRLLPRHACMSTQGRPYDNELTFDTRVNFMANKKEKKC